VQLQVPLYCQSIPAPKTNVHDSPALTGCPY
jgi:hypothetical protein